MEKPREGWERSRGRSGWRSRRHKGLQSRMSGIEASQVRRARSLPTGGKEAEKWKSKVTARLRMERKRLATWTRRE